MEGLIIREGRLLILVSTLLTSALGAPTLAVDANPSSYGTTETLKCTEASYSSGNNYIWEKDGVVIFTQAGEVSTTGKYSESIDEPTFKLVINNVVVSDEGAYTCNHNFANSDILNLQVESQGTATAKLSSSNLVEVTFNQIYPDTISAVITCDSNTVAGSFVSSVADGDRFKSTWQSTNTFSTKPTSCSASVTLRTTFSAGITFTTASNGDTDGLSTGAIVGIVIAAVVFVGIIIIVVCILAYFGKLPGKCDKDDTSQDESSPQNSSNPDKQKTGDYRAGSDLPAIPGADKSKPLAQNPVPLPPIKVKT